MATKRKSLKLQPRAPSMFPFHQSTDELVWLSFPNLHQEDIIPQDLIVQDQPSVGANKIGKAHAHKILSSLNNGEANTSNYDRKKIVRRDTEQKRRQQMAILNASLRSLLPVEIIQGKRSASDHMNEAVNYIKYLQNKIEELSMRRNKLRNLSPGNERSENCVVDRVMVHPCWGRVEIIMTGNVKKEGLLLSKVLEILLQEGFRVVSCVSTKANERLFYSIQSEVDNDLEGLDLPGLQRKLNDLILSSRRASESDIVSIC
ncbi:transcription factor bHLH118-like [Corylus avellana]|uniref:transcription factor bHLH118-like n=1 Tax=Corylus avellana TaxID=13451 RepID=UPI00286A44AD|nr:transcription factor bHLH118-like [Corylus avellana]